MAEVKESSPTTQWLIVYCAKDDSFSLIKDIEAVVDKDVLELEDKLKFIYGNEEFEGVVRAIGGDDDYDTLVVRLKELNASNRKKGESSFHADKPRKNREGSKYVEAMNALKPRSKQGQSNNKSAAKASQLTVFECGSDDTEASTSSTTSSPLPEDLSHIDLQKAAQIKRKGAVTDMKLLKKLKTCVETNPGSSSNALTRSEAYIVGSKVKAQDIYTDSEPEYGSGKGNSSEEENLEKTEMEETNQKFEKKKEVEEKKREAQDKKKKEGADKRKKEAEDRRKKEAEDRRKKEAEDRRKKEAEDRRKKEAEDRIRRKEAEDRIRRKEAEDRRKKEAGDKKKESHRKKRDEEDETEEDRNKGIQELMDEESWLDDDKEATEEKGSEKDDEQEKAKKEKKGKKSMEPLTADFNLLRWSEDDEDVLEVTGKSADLAKKKFYISHSDMQKAKGAKTASSFAKALLVGAFSDEALLKCSVSGGEYRAGGRDKITRKPALAPDVISVIVDNAIYRQAAKKWSPAQNKKEVIAGLRQKLVDVRGRLKQQFES